MILKRKEPSLKALVTKLKWSSYIRVTIITVKSQSAWDVQSYSCLNVKVLDFAPFVVCTWGNSSYHRVVIAELWRARRACGAPWLSKSTYPRKFGNHVTVHRPPAARPSAPQGNQCSIPHFLASLGVTGRLILHTYCTSMLSGIK